MGAWSLVNLYRFPTLSALPDPVGTMSLLVLAWTFCVGVNFVIAAPIFSMKAAAISFALGLCRAMNSLIIVLNDKGYWTYLSREVNCGIFGSLGAIPGSMIARIEHGQKS